MNGQLTFGDDHSRDLPILRLWSFADAPPEFRSVLAAPMTNDYWIAHVPRDLMQEPVLSFLQSNSFPSVLMEAARLADGSGLFAGPFTGSCLAT